MASRLKNEVTICGYIATEVTIMGKDRNVARFRIRWDKSKRVGEKWEKEASFFTVVAFGPENAEKISGFSKGEQVLVSGYLKQNQKEDGKEFIDIIADVVALTDPASQIFKPDPSDDDDWLNS